MKMARLEAAVRVTLKLYEAFNRHDVAGMVQLLSDDCIFENSIPAPAGAVYTGKEAIASYWQAFFHESPQAHIDIEEIFGLGARCVARWRYDWVDAVGGAGYVRGVDIMRVQSGTICEIVSYVKS